MMRCLNEIVRLLEEIKCILYGKDEMSDLEKTYKEYKFFADARGMKMLSDIGLVDEYNEFMSECESILFSGERILKIELPKPSAKLEAFKNRFNKFF